jgi:hypothetical protein
MSIIGSTPSGPSKSRVVVAKNLGHSDTRMVEKHYGHLAPSYITDAIRTGAPRYGIAAGKQVLPLR